MTSSRGLDLTLISTQSQLNKHPPCTSERWAPAQAAHSGSHVLRARSPADRCWPALLPSRRSHGRAGDLRDCLRPARTLVSPIGRCIDDLELIATAADPTDLANRVEYLPLR